MMRTENLAIMFTDMKGFTERTSRQTRAENERLLKVHEMLLVPTFRAFGGTVRKSIGDAYLVTFASPTNAVLCGAAIQDRLYTFNLGAPEADRIQVRVAINIGEVRVKQNDVFGEPVNVASRVEGIAEAKGIYFTEAVYLVMNKAEVPAEEVGLFELKGVPEKVRVFRVPHGPYRVSAGSVAADSLPEPSLPYGGIGLARAPDLSPPDLTSVDRALAARRGRRQLLALIRERKSSPGRWARLLPGELLTRIRERLSSAGTRWLWFVGGAAAVLLLVVLGIGELRARLTPPIERLIEAGNWKEARARADALPEGGERSFWRGRIAQAQRAWEEAIEDYRDAGQAQAWRHRTIDRLGEIADDGDCPAKVRVANAVRDIGDTYAIFVLDRLAKEKPTRASGMRGLLGATCDPRKAAEAARATLSGR
ncbi:MAG: adenylate/guanylate cyclase domain-containing protein [Thermoanaerobaculales bacterium]